MFKSWHDYIGLLGGVFLLFSFYRTVIGKWKNTSFWYELDNFVGAALLIFYAVHHGAYISVVLNVIWALAAFIGLEGWAVRKRKKLLPKKIVRKNNKR